MKCERTMSKREAYELIALKTGYTSTAVKAVFMAAAEYVRENQRRGNITFIDGVASIRNYVRNALYMAAVASIKWNAILGSYYHKKRAEGHPHKWAIVPTMRKMLSLLNRIARDPNFTPKPEPESTKQNANVGRRKKAA